MRVVVLGSGASLPTLKRRPAAVALQRGGDVFLFDCGEGTQLQWRRAGLRFGKLRVVCISHLHGDHVNGLVGFLQTLSLSDRKEPMRIFGPTGLKAYLDGLRRYQGFRVGYRLEVVESEGGPLMATEGYELRCAALDHGPPTLGFCVVEDERPGRFDLEKAARLGLEPGPEFGMLQRGESVTAPDGRTVRPDDVLGPPRPGKKFAYCVDTRPCQAAVDLGRDADLLLCDSTFADELEVEAVKRGHCTAAQAAGIARDAGAKRLLLTHVSARYHDTRVLLGEARGVFADVAVASDLMEVTV